MCFFYYREGIDYPEGGASREVKKNNMTKLRGLSGCGIWVLNPDSGKVKLAAIFFALKHGVGVGTRVSEIFRHGQLGSE